MLFLFVNRINFSNFAPAKNNSYSNDNSFKPRYSIREKSTL